MEEVAVLVLELADDEEAPGQNLPAPRAIAAGESIPTAEAMPLACS